MGLVSRIGPGVSARICSARATLRRRSSPFDRGALSAVLTREILEVQCPARAPVSPLGERCRGKPYVGAASARRSEYHSYVGAFI